MDDKSKIVNIKNFIKQEPGRLSSLNVTRDLSLGGSKPKKVYIPNLNVTRNKGKVNIGPARVQRGQSKRPPRQFNRNADSSRYVQSSGIFSEGAAAVKRPTLYSDKHSSVREQETSSGMIKPKLGNTWKIDIKKETSVVDDLLVCDDDSESDNDGEYEPIVLPLSANKNGFMNTFMVKKEMEVKQDPNVPLTNGFIKHGVDTPMSSFTSTMEFCEDDMSVSLVKMPDSLPGKGFDEDDNPIDYTLKQINEGKIGKILVRQSGKIEVVIGKTRYALDAIEAAQFTEELMCMPENDELKCQPRLTSLGFIHEKFVISPIWPDLLPQKKF